MNKRRRGHGEGSIYQRDDGQWCCSVDLGFANGRRRRRVIYGRTRKEVADKLKGLQRDQSLGIDIAPERQTVEQFLKGWLTLSVQTRNRPRTVESYRDLTRRYLVPALGSVELSRLTPSQIQTMLNSLSERGLSARTVQYVRAVLRRALNQAMKWGYVQRNVAALTDAPRAAKPQITPLDAEQAKRLLEAVKGHRLEVLYRVGLALGLRRGEMLGLRWADVDFDQHRLHVRTALQYQNGKLELTQPKSASGIRTLALPPVLEKALKAHYEAQQEEKAFYGAEWKEHGLVFPSRVGTPMGPRNLLRMFKEALRKAGLPETTRLHDLRHSCATLLIAQGVHPRVIMDILGHSQISVTMNVYGHVLPETQSAAMGKLDALLSDADDGAEQ